MTAELFVPSVDDLDGELEARRLGAARPQMDGFARRFRDDMLESRKLGRPSPLFPAMPLSDIRVARQAVRQLSPAAQEGAVDSVQSLLFWRVIRRAARRVDLGLGAGVRRGPQGREFRPFDGECWYGVEGCSCLTSALDDRVCWRGGRAAVACLARRRHVGPRARRLPSPPSIEPVGRPRFAPNPPRARPEPPSYAPTAEPVQVARERPRAPVVRRARPSQADALARVAAATGLTVYDGRQHSVHSTFTKRR